MLDVAIKETKEETSLKIFKVVYDKSITIDSLPCLGHFKRGKYIPAHIDLSVAYLFEADEKDAIHIKEDENSNIAWLTFDEPCAKTMPYMINVINKIIIKIKLLKQEKSL